MLNRIHELFTAFNHLLSEFNKGTYITLLYL